MNPVLARSLALLCLGLMSHTFAYAGLVDKAKASKEAYDKAANQPVKVAVGKGKLMDSSEDLQKVIAACKKKIGTEPLMTYGLRINFSNQLSIVYQTRFDKEKLEMLGYANGQIDGKPAAFKLIGAGKPKVADNIFNLDQVNIRAIPDLVKAARERTSQASGGKKTLGANVQVVQSADTGRPVRIVVSVAADDKTAIDNIGEALTALKEDKVAKGSSVGRLVADANGKILDFQMR